MVENIIAFLRQALLNDELAVLLLSVLPMIEIRGAVPIAIGMDMNVFLAIFLSVLGATLAVIPNMIFVKPFIKYLKGTKLMKELAENFENDVNKKSEEINKKTEVKRYKNLSKYIAVAMFVAVPVPFTGAYTGSTIAVFLGLNPVKSLIAVMAGNVISAGLIALLSIYFKQHLDIIIAILAIVVLFAFLVYVYNLVFKKRIKVFSDGAETSKITMPRFNLRCSGVLNSVKENFSRLQRKDTNALLKKVGVIKYNNKKGKIKRKMKKSKRENGD